MPSEYNIDQLYEELDTIESRISLLESNSAQKGEYFESIVEQFEEPKCCSPCDNGNGEDGGGSGGDNGGGNGGDDGGGSTIEGEPFIIRYDATTLNNENGVEVLQSFSNVTVKYTLREVVGVIKVTINDGAVRTYGNGYLVINDFQVYRGDVVKIYGSFKRINIDHMAVFHEDHDKYIYDIDSFGDNPLTHVTCGENVRHVPKVKPPTLGVSGMFGSESDGQRYFTGEDVVDWDVSGIVSFANTFKRCSHMTVSLAHWDYTNATEIGGFLAGSSAQFGNYLFPSVVNAGYVFGGSITKNLSVSIPLANATSTLFSDGLDIAPGVMVTASLSSTTTVQGMFSNSTFGSGCVLNLNVPNATNYESLFSSSDFIGGCTLNVDYTNAENVNYLFGWCDFTQASTEFKDSLRALHITTLNSAPRVFDGSIGMD